MARKCRGRVVDAHDMVSRTASATPYCPTSVDSQQITNLNICCLAALRVPRDTPALNEAQAPLPARWWTQCSTRPSHSVATHAPRPACVDAPLGQDPRPHHLI